MAVACREQIVAAFAARLAAIAGIAGLTAERGRDQDDPITDDVVPILVVLQGVETPHGEGECFLGERAATLVIAVEGYIAGATPTDAKQQAAVLRAAAERALLTDDTLGGLARDLRLMSEPPPPRLTLDAAQPVAGFATGFEVDYATLESDPFTFA